MIKSYYKIDGGWDNEYLGNDPTVKFYPDAYANYWRYGFERKKNLDHIGLKVSGLFPDARYMSINVYNDKNFTPISHITDYELVPDEGSINPFIATNMRLDSAKDSSENNYTLYVVPKGTQHIQALNVVYFDSSLEKIAIILRYYLPGKNAKGGVPLPTIEAFDTLTGEVSLVSKEVDKMMSPRRAAIRSRLRDAVIKNGIRPLFLLNRNGNLYSYHLSGKGMYPNKDNNYLAMPIKRKSDEVALIKLKAPRLNKNHRGDVRYYSIGQGDTLSHNLLTLCDEDITVANDGYIYIVIGDECIKDRVNTPYNYMPWKTDNKMVLIYRNMVSDQNYMGNINQVPSLKESKRTPANAYIGYYAPKGKLVTMEDFKTYGFDCL